MRIIGIDCAVAPEKTGVVVARQQGSELIVEGSERGSEERPPVRIVLEAMEPDTLLALDAPLGWPDAFGRALANHCAGAALPVEPERFFRRETDDWVARKLGKRPMDPAADRIGRTAYAALSLLDGVRGAGWVPLSLAWSPEEARSGVHAVEVYPAGRLTVLGLPAQGYKRAGQRPRRQEILEALVAEFDLSIDRGPYLEDADQLDALLCVAAAADMLRGLAAPPENIDRARKEGWVWTRLE